jgi:hypothetical protein
MSTTSMHPSHVAIDVATLRTLYVDDRLTVDQIAIRLGCGATTIGRRLRGASIPRRRRGPVPAASGEVGVSPVIGRSPNVAYAVGIIATDGNLSKRRGRLTVVSKDTELLDTVRLCVQVTASIAPHASGYGGPCYHVAWTDRGFYDALLAIGLTPAKSRTLGAVMVPDEYFAGFLRGCIDGDGSIITDVDRYNTFQKATYVYTRVYVSLVSASQRFIEWLRTSIRRFTGLSGDVTVRTGALTRNDLWRLRYAKRESPAILRWIYYAPDVPCLGRKRDIAAPLLIPREQSGRRGPGDRW